jgi:hypothetical protein
VKLFTCVCSPLDRTDIVASNHRAEVRARACELTLLRLVDATRTQAKASLIGRLAGLIVPRLVFAVSLSIAFSALLSFPLSVLLFPLSAALSFVLLAAVG